MPNPSPASAPGNAHDSPDRKALWAVPRDRAAILLLVAFSVLLYIATTGYEFVGDDNVQILRNPYVRSFHYLQEIFTRGFWSFRGPQEELSFYRPLVTLTLLLERVLFGFRPAGFHLLNVFLNAVVVVLVYMLAKRLWPEGRGALWAGLLFASLPVHTENVASVLGITDLECAVLFLSATLAYMNHRNSTGGRSGITHWVAGALLFLAALAKEVALALPLLLIFYEHGLRLNDRSTTVEKLRRYFPTLVFAAVYFALRHKVLGGVARAAVRRELGTGAVVLAGLDLLGKYIFKLVWPQHLTAFESFHPPQAWREPFVVIGAATLFLSAVAFSLCWTRHREVSFAVLWFYLTLGPALNVQWLALSPYGERYLYIPSMAFCWLLGEGLGRLDRPNLSPRARMLLARALPVLLVGVATARTALRLPEWKNDFTLASATLREDPGAAPFRVYLGMSYVRQNLSERAREEFATALTEDPTLGEAYIDLAALLVNQGRAEEARAVLERAVKLNPLFADGYYSLGVIELGQGQAARARRFFERTLELNPDYAEALNNLGLLLLGEGTSARAQALLERAVRADPSYAEAHNNLGSVCARQGDPKRAETEFRRAIELSPSSEKPYLNLATLYEQQSNPRAALETYRAAVEAQPNSGNARFRLGVLALKLGEVEEAIRALRSAAEIQPDSALAHTQLGLAYVAAGKRLEARGELEMALRLNPGDESAGAALQKLR